MEPIMTAQGLGFPRLFDLNSFSAAAYKVKQKNSILENVNQNMQSKVNTKAISEYSSYSSFFLRLPLQMVIKFLLAWNLQHIRKP
jgi:hypothetical protein